MLQGALGRQWGGHADLACCSPWPQSWTQQQLKSNNSGEKTDWMTLSDPIEISSTFEGFLYITSLLQKSCKEYMSSLYWKNLELVYNNEKKWKQRSVFILQEANEPLDRQQQRGTAKLLPWALHSMPLISASDTTAPNCVCGHLCFLGLFIIC